MLVVVFFMLLFNVSSLPLMFYVVGGFGTILPRTFTVDVWIEWGSDLFWLLGLYVYVWAGDYFTICVVQIF